MRELSIEEMAGKISRLAPHEVHYLRLLLTGSSDREIANGMHVSIRTVKKYSMEICTVLFDDEDRPHGAWNKRICLAVRVSQACKLFPLVAEALDPRTKLPDSYTAVTI